MNTYKSLILCIVTSLLIACGGGGGGSDSGNGGSGSGGDGGSSGGGDSGDGDGGSNPPTTGSSDATAPTAEIIFPLPVSRTTASTITVRGTASDANTVSAIRVNGVAAQLGAATVSAAKTSKKSQKTANKQLATITSTVSITAEEELIEWEVELAVPKDSTLEINVETEDEFGNTNSTADTASVTTQKVPTNFTIDKVNHRLIGQAEHNKLVVLV